MASAGDAACHLSLATCHSNQGTVFTAGSLNAPSPEEPFARTRTQQRPPTGNPGRVAVGFVTSALCTQEAGLRLILAWCSLDPHEV